MMLPKMSMHQNDSLFLFQLCHWNSCICSNATKMTFQILIPCFNQNCLEKEPFLKVPSQSPLFLFASQCITHTLSFSWLCMMVLTNFQNPQLVTADLFLQSKKCTTKAKCSITYVANSISLWAEQFEVFLLSQKQGLWHDWCTNC